VAAINWENGVNGDWDVAADWSTGALPTSADEVTFFTAEPYIVTVGAAISIGFGTLRSTIFPTANSLTFDAPDAALRENTGMLTVAGTLTVNSGLVSLKRGELDRQRRSNGRRPRSWEFRRVGCRRGLLERRGTGRHGERKPRQLDQFFRNFDDRGRERNDVEGNRDC
jgi:hypothetical protein